MQDRRRRVVAHGRRPAQLREAGHRRQQQLLVQRVQTRHVQVDPAQRAVVRDGENPRARERPPVRPVLVVLAGSQVWIVRGVLLVIRGDER